MVLWDGFMGVIQVYDHLHDYDTDNGMVLIILLMMICIHCNTLYRSMAGRGGHRG